jgi:hypothetical protein
MKIFTRILFFVLSISLPFLSYGQTIIPVRAKKSTNSYFDKMPLPPGFRAGLHPLVNQHVQKKEQILKGFTYHIDTAVIYSNYNNPKRYVYFYDTAGNQTITVQELWVNGNWENFSKDSAVYDSVGNRLALFAFKWNNGIWEKASFSHYTYTVNHKILTRVSKIWKNNKWEYADSTHFAYNFSGQKVSSYYATWNDTAWLNNYFNLFVYDSVGNLTTSLFSQWNDSVWLEKQKVEYVYDSASNLIHGLILKEGDTSAWVNFYQEFYSYDKNGNKLSYTGQIWNDSVWVNDQRYQYDYNNLRQLATAVGENWNDSVWVYFEKGQYTYSDFGGIENFLHQIWKDTLWYNNSLLSYQYDSVGNAYEGNYFIWDSASQNWSQRMDGLMEIYYNYASAVRYYTGYQVKLIYNRPITTGITKKHQNILHLEVFPNPAVHHATIRFGLDSRKWVNVSFYDLTGKKLFTLFRGMLDQGEHQVAIPVSSLSSGIYFTAVSTGDFVKTNKLIIRK